MRPSKQQALATSMPVILRFIWQIFNQRNRTTPTQLATQYFDVAQRIKPQVDSNRVAQSIGELTVIREDLNALLAELRRDVAYAEVQNNYGKVLVSMGLDPLPEGFGAMDLEQLSAAFQALTSKWQQGDLGIVNTTPEPAVQHASE